MKRKITLLAFGATMAARAARGLLKGVTPSAAKAWLFRKPSVPIRPASARDVNPPPMVLRNSRRVRPQKEPRGLSLVIEMYSSISRRRAKAEMGLMGLMGRMGSRDLRAFDYP